MQENEVKEKEKVNYKTVLLSALVSALMCIIVGCVVVVCVIKFTDKKISGIEESANIAQVATDAGVNEIAIDQGVAAPEETGGTFVMTTSSGESITYNIPDDHYNITAEYLALVPASLGIDDTVSAENFLVTGNSQSVSTSFDSINASTFSELYNVYAQLYGDEFTQEGPDAVYSPCYSYIVDGIIPEDAPVNYTLDEKDTIEKDGITYRVFAVDYDTIYTITYADDGTLLDEPEESTVHTQHLAAYSDTKDPIEIVVYSNNNSVDSEIQMLKKFIMNE